MNAEIQKQIEALVKAVRTLRVATAYEAPGLLHIVFAESLKLDQLERERAEQPAEWP